MTDFAWGYLLGFISFVPVCGLLFWVYLMLWLLLESSSALKERG